MKKWLADHRKAALAGIIVASAGVLVAIMGVGIQVVSVLRDYYDIGSSTKSPSSAPAANTPVVPPSITPSSDERMASASTPWFEWVQPENNSLVERCYNTFRVRLRSGQIPNDTMLVLSVQRYDGPAMSHKAGFRVFPGERDVWELPMTVGSADPSNQDKDFAISLRLAPKDKVARLATPDKSDYYRWSSDSPIVASTEVADRLTVHRNTQPANCTS